MSKYTVKVKIDPNIGNGGRQVQKFDTLEDVSTYLYSFGQSVSVNALNAKLSTGKPYSFRGSYNEFTITAK